MTKLFKNDYSELMHPEILNALSKYSLEQNTVYGLDYHSGNAAKEIKKVFNAKKAEVYFISGGTQTNLLFISNCLRHYEGVICADTGHINVHETAAIEGHGYKIITIKNVDGKITPSQIEDTINQFNDEHMVKPRMVYISNSTETGTIYKKQELIDLSKVCKRHNLYFFIDGARLGSALTCKENDVDPSLLGEVCDAFYIGGNKNGLYLAEALVINNPSLQEDFRYHIKNQGAMMAKGYGAGIQFERAFQDDLYFSLARKSNLTAEKLKEGLLALGIKTLPSCTNQIFAYFDSKNADILMKRYGLELWMKENNQIILRFVTSFNIEPEDVDELLNYLKELL